MARGGRGKVYTIEFKQSAIEYAKRGELTINEVANNLGVNSKTLHNWLRKDRLKSGTTTDSNITKQESVEEELKRLRKENARLKMERDILKKATAYFAKETL